MTSRPKEESRSGCRHGSPLWCQCGDDRWWQFVPCCRCVGENQGVRGHTGHHLLSPLVPPVIKHSATQGHPRSGPTGQRLTGLWEVELSGLPQPPYKPPWGPCLGWISPDKDPRITHTSLHSLLLPWGTAFRVTSFYQRNSGCPRREKLPGGVTQQAEQPQDTLTRMSYPPSIGIYARSPLWNP